MVTTQAVLCPHRKLAVPRGRRDLAIDYLRATLVMIVVAAHSAMPYESSGHFGWRNMILSDQTRSAVVDNAISFVDSFCMALMFFVSGLFVDSALRRHGIAAFIGERFRRLGLPFAFSVAFLLPVAMYAPWRLTGHSAGFARFYLVWPAPGFPIGPPWFLWQLLFFDLVLGLSLLPLRRWTPRLRQSMSRLQDHPAVAFVAIVFVVECAYLPMLHRYGSGWTDFFVWPLSVQPARFGFYALWFLFGCFVGAPGIDNGLIATNGSLARYYPRWILAAILAFGAFCFVPGWLMVHALNVPHIQGLQALLWVISGAASSFAFLAFFRGVKLPSFSWMKSLSRGSYGIYLVHYVFIAWSQYLVWNRPMNAGLKFLAVFVATTMLSWLTTQALLRIPMLRTIL